MIAILTTTYAEQYAVRVLTVASLIGVVLYGILVFSVVLNTVDRQNMQYSLQNITSQLTDLDSRYIAQAKNIDLSYVRMLGYEDATDIKFAKKYSGLGIVFTPHNGI
jgi:uncharacterized protein YggT (Ycf19 family)